MKTKSTIYLLFLLLTIGIANAAYQPKLEMSLKVGNNRHIGRLSALVPLWQQSNRLLFGSLIGMHDTKENKEGNFGLGVRQLIEDKGIIGIYGFYDIRLTQFNNRLHQWTIGLEYLTSSYEIRSNVYIPRYNYFKLDTKIKDIPKYYGGTKAFVSTRTNNIVEETFGGFDVEVGHNVPAIKDLVGFVKYYRFSNQEGTKVMHGISLRSNYQLFPWLSIEGEWSYDKLRKHNYFLGITLSYKIGKKYNLTSLQEKMTQLPVRDIDIVTKEGERFVNETQLDAIPIRDYEELRQIGQTLDKPLNGTYVQIGDIDAGITRTLNPVMNADGTINYEGHEPIGPNKENPFTGKYYGGYKDEKGQFQIFTINNLYINRMQCQKLGLFGSINNSKIEYVGLTNVDMHGGKVTYIGGLVGWADTNNQIINSYSTGNIVGGTDASNGGLVGSAYENNQIINSYSIGNVTGGDNAHNGGLVGSATRNNAIISSYSKVDVSGGNGADIGGLLGMSLQNNQITNSYSIGNVTGGNDAEIGGLLGISLLDHQITNSYSIGNVTGGDEAKIGGLVGYSKHGSNETTNSYYIADLNPIGQGQHGGDVVVNSRRLTLDEMKNPANFVGWNFRAEIQKEPGESWWVMTTQGPLLSWDHRSFGDIDALTLLKRLNAASLGARVDLDNPYKHAPVEGGTPPSLPIGMKLQTGLPEELYLSVGGERKIYDCLLPFGALTANEKARIRDYVYYKTAYDFINIPGEGYQSKGSLSKEQFLRYVRYGR